VLLYEFAPRITMGTQPLKRDVVIKEQIPTIISSLCYNTPVNKNKTKLKTPNE